MEKENFQSVKESISTILAFVCLASLMIVPLYFLVVTRRYLKEIKAKKENETLSRYSLLFEAYKKNNKSLMYQSLYFFRRYALLITLTFLHVFGYAQILCQIISTMFMIGYMASERPYVSKLSNL